MLVSDVLGASFEEASLEEIQDVCACPMRDHLGCTLSLYASPLVKCGLVSRRYYAIVSAPGAVDYGGNYHLPY